jgi:hypothetical protein
MSSSVFLSLVLSLWVVLAVAFPLAAAARRPKCEGVVVEPGTDIQSVIDASPEGATLCVHPGVYRITIPLNPKNNQSLMATGSGTVLNGSKLITGFVPSGSSFVARGFLPKRAEPDANCVVSGCRIEQDVFFDGAPLRRVLSLRDLAPGTFFEDFPRDLIYLRDDPTGHEVEQAYAPRIVQSSNSGVTVDGFIIEKAAVPAQFGAIDAEYSSGRGWFIENNEVRYNHGAGITAYPSTETAGGSTIAANYVHHNGQEGVEACGSNMVVRDNEIAVNNTAGFDPFWEAGGSKFGCSPPEIMHLTVQRNHVHDNSGNGIWCDINCYDVTISGNTVARNAFTYPQNGDQVGDGILIEISDRCMISNNTLQENGFAATAPNTSSGFYVSAAILIAASPNCEVYGNTVIGVQGIGMLQQDRTDQCTLSYGSTYPDGNLPCPDGFHQVYNTYIHDNTSTETAQPSNPEVAGLDEDFSDPAAFTSKNNRYVHNTYHLPVLEGDYFSWFNLLNNKDQWVADGQDTTGTFLSP